MNPLSNMLPLEHAPSSSSLLSNSGRHIVQFLDDRVLALFQRCSRMAHDLGEKNPSRDVAIKRITTKPDTYDSLNDSLKRDPEILSVLMSKQPNRIFNLGAKDLSNKKVLRGLCCHELSAIKWSLNGSLSWCETRFQDLSRRVLEGIACPLDENELHQFSHALKRQFYLQVCLPIVRLIKQIIDCETFRAYLDPNKIIYNTLKSIPRELLIDKTFFNELVSLEPIVWSILFENGESSSMNPIPKDFRTGEMMKEFIHDKRVLLSLVRESSKLSYSDMTKNQIEESIVTHIHDKGFVRELIKVDKKMNYVALLPESIFDNEVVMRAAMIENANYAKYITLRVQTIFKNDPVLSDLI